MQARPAGRGRAAGDALDDAVHPLPAVQRERLLLAQRNAARLEKLVNTLLDFSRVQAGRMQASYAEVDLPALTADLASGFRSRCWRSASTG